MRLCKHGKSALLLTSRTQISHPQALNSERYHAGARALKSHARERLLYSRWALLPMQANQILYAFVSIKSERDKSYKIHSDDSQCLVIDSVLVAKPSGRVDLNLTRGLGACKNVGPATKKSLAHEFRQVRKLILLFFSQKYKNILTCGKPHPQSPWDWMHLDLCLVDRSLYDLQISPVHQIRAG